MTEILRITAKRDGYRRCGLQHSGSGTDHEKGKFSPEQLEILKADPGLVVQELVLGPDGKPMGAAELVANTREQLADIARLQEEANADREQARADREQAAQELKQAEEIRQKAEADAAKTNAAEGPAGVEGGAGKNSQDANATGGATGAKPKAKPKGKAPG